MVLTLVHCGRMSSVLLNRKFPMISRIHTGQAKVHISAMRIFAYLLGVHPVAVQ
jgi:hypothetical protein